KLLEAAMGDSSGSVSIDVERIYFGGKEHPVRTRYGPVSVSVYGDEDKPALITYPDVALNCECCRFLCGWCYKFCYNKVAHVLYSCLVDMSCFQGLFFCPEAASLLLHNFCIYHITPQGHELGAAPIPSDVPE
uniref:Uncharacterized protein n=1 Tax=Aegilops tauschii subsp. strangulata TaxID=200361 RepID=A0A453E5X2_AEGTS